MPNDGRSLSKRGACGMSRGRSAETGGYSETRCGSLPASKSTVDTPEQGTARKSSRLAVSRIWLGSSGSPRAAARRGGNSTRRRVWAHRAQPCRFEQGGEALIIADVRHVDRLAGLDHLIQDLAVLNINR